MNILAGQHDSPKGHYVMEYSISSSNVLKIKVYVRIYIYICLAQTIILRLFLYSGNTTDVVFLPDYSF